MDKITVDQMVKDYIDKISIPYQKDPGYDYLKQIVSNYKLGNLDGLLKSDIFEVFKGFFYLEQNRQIPIDDVCNIIDTFRGLLEDVDNITLDTLKTLFTILRDNDLFDLGIEYLSNKSEFKGKILEIKVQNAASKNLSFALYLVKQQYKDILPQIVDCLKIAKDHPEITELFYFLVLRNDVLDVIDGAKYAKEITKMLKGKVNKKATADAISCDPHVVAFLELVKIIPDFIREEEQNEKKSKKKCDSELYTIKNAMVLLNNALKKDEVTNARVIVNSIHDEDVKLAIVQLIYEHNNAYYERLDSKIEKLSNNSTAQYSKILADYKINTENYDIAVIMHNSLEELDAMLKVLCRCGLTNEMILYILTFGNYSKFLEINEFRCKGFLSIEYLKNNLQVFCTESNLLDYYKDNIKVLVNFGVNPQLFSNSSHLLFDSTDIFKNNINILVEYDLLKYLKTTDNYEFLSFPDLVKKIDMLIEFGYIDLLKQDLGLLNYGAYNRLFVVKSLGMDINEKEQLLEILDSSNRFFVPDNQISKFLSNIKKKNVNDSIFYSGIDINDYKDTTRTYTIDGVILSSNRVDRLLEQGKNMGDAITEGSIISSDEYEQIINYLKQSYK